MITRSVQAFIADEAYYENAMHIFQFARVSRFESNPANWNLFCWTEHFIFILDGMISNEQNIAAYDYYYYRKQILRLPIPAVVSNETILDGSTAHQSYTCNNLLRLM